MRRQVLVALAAIMALSVMAVPASAAGHLATLNVVHGVPGLTVDVCAGPAGGELGKVITDFDYKEVESLGLEPGSYDAAVVAAGDDCTAAILSASGLALASGDNVDVVAHLLEGGAPALSAFANNTKALKKEIAQLTVRHAADAPIVDVWVSRGSWDMRRARTIFEDVPNGAGGDKFLKRAWWSIAVTPADSANPVIGPASFRLANRTGYVVYAVGSLGGGLDVIVHAIDRK